MPALSDTTSVPAVPLQKLAEVKSGVLHPEDSVETAGRRMREHDAEAWPVAEDRKLVGMVDEKNPDWKIGGHGHDPKEWQVGQIMKRQLLFCYEDEDCRQAQKLMEEHGVQHLPVVDRNMQIVGIYSREDIDSMAASQQSHKEIEQRAMEIARQDGRDAFTEDDFAAAVAERRGGRSDAGSNRCGS